RGSALVLEGGVDSAVRSAAVFKSFIGHYEAMRAAQLGRAAGDASDGEDEFMRMNLATCSASVRAAGAAVVSASAPVTPRAHERARGPGGLGALPATNPFFAASPVTGDAGPTAVELPFVEHSRSSSSIVAETGCLRSSSSIVAETGCLRSLRSPPQTAEADIKSAHALLQRSMQGLALDAAANDGVSQDLQSIIQMAQTLLSKSQKV
ncbi:hypothetical protein H4S02_005223, partial [Coemansia sp. RSA 2611]